MALPPEPIFFKARADSRSLFPLHFAANFLTDKTKPSLCHRRPTSALGTRARRLRPLRQRGSEFSGAGRRAPGPLASPGSAGLLHSSPCTPSQSAVADPSGKKYCVPLTGWLNLSNNSRRSSFRSTKSISEVSTTSRLLDL